MKFEWDPSSGAEFQGAHGISWASSRDMLYFTDYVTGSFVIPAATSWNPPAAATVSDTTTNLSSVSSNAVGALGWFTATQSGGYGQGGVTDGGIHQIGGTTLLMVGAVRMYPDTLSVNYLGYLTGVVDTAAAFLLTMWVESGFLKARVQRYCPADPYAPQNWIGLAANDVTITYHAFAYALN